MLAGKKKVVIVVAVERHIAVRTEAGGALDLWEWREWREWVPRPQWGGDESL